MLKTLWTLILLVVLNNTIHAGTGNLFVVTSSGSAPAANIILCLNGQGPLSCQNYQVTGPCLSIRTTIPFHIYPAAGIKVNTPGITLTGCTPIYNGYCLFSVNSQTPTTVCLNQNEPTPTPSAYTVGGTVTGYTNNGLVLQNNGSDNLTLSTNGTFTFPVPLETGSTYNITVAVQPPGQICSVLNGTGTIGTQSVTNVSVTCSAITYNITASSGVNGSISPNGTIAVNAGGSQTFTATADSGYEVNQWLLDGTVVQTGGNTYQLTNTTTSHTIEVTFNSITPTTYTVGGTVTGYTSSGLVLQNNGMDNLVPSGNGPFTFSTPLVTGATYSVTVSTQPAGQICSVLNGTGTIGTSNVTNVSVTCSAITYTITASSGVNGSISPSGAVIVNQGGNQTFTATPNSGYEVNQWLLDGALAQTGGTTYQLLNVTANHTVDVSFSIIPTPTYTVGGTITGYTSSGLVLQNNGTDDLVPTGDGPFTFPTPLVTGATYSVTVSSQPAGEICSVLNDSGTIGTSNVTNVSVTCSAITYTITASSGANGSISPSGAVVVNQGGNQTFTATANSGFAVNQWLLDGALAQTGGTTYQLLNVTANHTVDVSFSSTATTLTATPTLALSVTGLTTTTGNNSGTARRIIITNTGSNIANNVTYSLSPALPSGSSISPASCGNIAIGGTCTLTVTPGATPSAPANNSNPTPVTVTISGTNTNVPTSSVSILTYGSFYQAGWLFSIIERANTFATIGGTVAGQSDVAGQSTTQYSPGGANTTSSMYSGTNGSTNTSAMRTQYGTGTNYSAGRCISPNYTAGGFTDWYLPSICQMGYAVSDTNFNCTNSGSANYIPNIQVNLLQRYPTQLFNFVNNGYYWSSTASQGSAPGNAWTQEYILGGAPALSSNDPVNFIHGIRCARNLT